MKKRYILRKRDHFNMPIILIALMIIFVSCQKNKIITIENDVLGVEINLLGAELYSIFHKESSEEYLWQGDPDFWDARSPVMFPVNVRFRNDSYTWKGKRYEMPRLGLAVDRQFRIIESISADKVILELSSNKETLKFYPFPFRFEITYSLEGNQLINRFLVENTGKDTMHFALGGHPGLRCPLDKEKTRGSYRLVFPEKLDLSRQEVDSSLVQPSVQTFLENEDGFFLDDPRVPGSGMLLLDIPVRKIGIAYKNYDPYVSVNLGDFPNVNIWTPPGMPYVCIEPMVGHHDLYNSPSDIKMKPFIISLPPGESKDYYYSIIIHGGIPEKK